MKRVKLLKLVSIFLSIAAILIKIFFFLRNLVSKHQNIHSLFFSTYEFITGAKSGKVAVFAVFYAVVITVFLWRSKPSSAADFDDEFFVPSPHMVHELYNTEKEKVNNEDYNSQDDKEHDEYHGYDGYDEDNDDELDEEDVNSEDEVTDMDLEKRIEEFISNVYKKWGEELLAERLLLLELAN